MDERAHRRFLAYLESHEYFGRPERKKLDREAWSELDAELTGLLTLGVLTAQDRRRMAELRGLLFRD
jgi:hypothetical protein